MNKEDIVMDIDEMSVLDRRRIEAQVVGPLIRAFQKEFGETKANEVARSVIAEIARDQGRQLAQRLGNNDLAAFSKAKEPWTRNGALQVETIEETSDTYSFNVTRCRYAEMYKEIGLSDLGFTLSCNRDFTLSEGFNSRIKLTRTQTIMLGAPFCDFRYTQEDEPAGAPDSR